MAVTDSPSVKAAGDAFVACSNAVDIGKTTPELAGCGSALSILRVQMEISRSRRPEKGLILLSSSPESRSLYLKP